MNEVTAEEKAHVAALVKRHLGFPGLREGQAEIMARVLRGEDVLAVLPTGGGKSLCYQLPGVLSPGVTLVVSPLIALMKDQLDSLPAPMRAAAVSITGELAPREVRRVLQEVAIGRYRLVYVAPERLRQAPLVDALRRAGVKRFVVDEAHCVSVWGHDFRPDYLALGDVRRLLGQPPLLALTATAPPRVLQDIQERLGAMHVVRASVFRPNLRLEAILAKDADEKLAHLLQLCQETKGPGIVYASSRAKTEQVAAGLERAGVNALAYHAGLPDRGPRQEAFMRGDVEILVATVAFGMGVDKGDIRFVFHHDPSSSLENYYQEAGRAGRDGGPARCVLLATGADGGTLKQRAKADLPTRELVEAVWRLVREGMAEDGYALVEPDALRGLAGDDVSPRVALSVLQEAGALERLADAPRFLRLVGAESGLPTGTDIPLFQLAGTLGAAPEQVEPTLLARPGLEAIYAPPRSLLLRVRGEPDGVDEVLERYQQRALRAGEEVMAYVKADACRHAMLRRHFGETDAPARCGACDHCLGIRHAPPEAPAADEEEAARQVLGALSGVRGLGEVNLVYLLRGDARAADWLQRKSSFGALAFRSESRIRAVLRRLEAQGLIEKERLPHGGMTLRLGKAGEAALGDDARLLPETPPAPPPGASGAAPADLAPEAARTFDALKAWRRARADAETVPAYIVASDATLRAIAEARPRDAAALQAVKGMGPKKVERYGEDILRVVAQAG